MQLLFARLLTRVFCSSVLFFSVLFFLLAVLLRAVCRLLSAAQSVVLTLGVLGQHAQLNTSGRQGSGRLQRHYAEEATAEDGSPGCSR